MPISPVKIWKKRVNPKKIARKRFLAVFGSLISVDWHTKSLPQLGHWKVGKTASIPR